MAGLTGLLNVAKNSLLTEQLALQTTGHNVSNVNTPGYCRQQVQLTARIPTPSEIGPIGNGVEATQITRAYDRFITTTLFNKTSIEAGLDTRVSGMKMIEDQFNEVNSNGLAQLLNQFWSSWDDLANNAEGLPERTTLLQRATLLAKTLKDKYNSLVKLSHDVDLNIETNIKDINQLADQIAQLNVQIVAEESSHHKANDLRDQRDELVKKLSKLANIHYFETQRGSYTVLIGQGSPLVEDDKSWHLELANNQVNWVANDGTLVPLSNEDISAGELGAWMDIKSRVSPPDTTKLISTQPNTCGGAPIKAATRWDQIDGVTVSGSFTINFSGTDEDGKPIEGSFTYTPTSTNATVGDFLNAIETAYEDTSASPPIQRVKAGITDDGRIYIQDLHPGNYPITFQIDSIQGNVTGLNLGKFDGSYPPNYLVQLNNIGKELIKAVNAQHAQGVGLDPLKEVTGIYSALNTTSPIGHLSSGLKFSSEVKDGSFQIWLYDKNGNVIDFDPSTPEVNDPLVIHVLKDHTSLEDIKNAINNAYFAGTSPPQKVGLRATIVNGKLVIQPDGTTDVAGFAFGKDTSGALLALGLNAFFTGYDAATIGINPEISQNQRLIAAAKVSKRGSNQATSGIALSDKDRPVGTKIQSGSFSIWVYNQNNQRIDMDPSTSEIDPIQISIDPQHTTIQDIIDKINDVDGLSADVEGGKIRIKVTNPDWKGISFGPDSSGILKYLGIDSFEIDPIDGPEIVSRNAVTDPNIPLNSPDSGLTSSGLVHAGSFQLLLYDPNGKLVSGFPQTVTVDSDPTLNEIASQIGTATTGIPDVTAEITSDNRLALKVPSGYSLVLKSDSSGVLTALGLAQMGTDFKGLYQLDPVSKPVGEFVKDVKDGQFYIYNYDDKGRALASDILGSKVNTSSGTPITSSTLFSDIDGVSLTGNFHIHFSGVKQDGTEVSGVFDGDPTSSTVGDFLTAVENAFGGPSNVHAFITDSGKLCVSSLTGEPISFQVDDITYDNQGDGGIDFGTTNAAPSLTGSKANTSAGLPITESTTWGNIDGVSVTGTFQIEYEAIDSNGNKVDATYTGTSTDTVGSFLSDIESSFGGSNIVDAKVDPTGRITLISQNGLPITFHIKGITGSISGLDLGKFSGLYTVEVNSQHDGLAEIASKIDNMPGLSAQVQNGRIEISAKNRVSNFVLAGDSSGLLNAIDLFTPKGGDIAPANNENALSIRDISRMPIQDLDGSSINEAYQGLVGTVGIQSKGFQLDYDFAKQSLDQLQQRRDAVSAVSLDEEMTNLIKYQHAYVAAAKLIKSADEMFDSLLSVK